LNHAAGIRRADADAARLAKLEAVIAQATDSPGEALPLLADLLGITCRRRCASRERSKHR
jgi:hypothetical protein